MHIFTGEHCDRNAIRKCAYKQQAYRKALCKSEMRDEFFKLVCVVLFLLHSQLSKKVFAKNHRMHTNAPFVIVYSPHCNKKVFIGICRCFGNPTQLLFQYVLLSPPPPPSLSARLFRFILLLLCICCSKRVILFFQVSISPFTPITFNFKLPIVVSTVLTFRTMSRSTEIIQMKRIGKKSPRSRINLQDT